jgi:BlaI family transcriptional regulator, penicillinase repressor
MEFDCAAGTFAAATSQEDNGMPRPSHDQPTPGELEILKILWDVGPLSGRDVMERLNEDGRGRAYTSVTSLMNVMVEKRLLKRKPDGRAFVYSAAVPRKKALGNLLNDLIGRAFEGSANDLVAHLLNETQLSNEELTEIRKTISADRKKRQH